MRHSPRKRSLGFDLFDYSDLHKKEFTSSRHVNPLNPTYVARNEAGQVTEIGPVEGSVPNATMPER